MEILNDFQLSFLKTKKKNFFSFFLIKKLQKKALRNEAKKNKSDHQIVQWILCVNFLHKYPVYVISYELTVDALP